MAAAGAMHHHERVGSGAVDDAVIDELAVLVEHRGVHRFAGVELGDVAGGGPLQQAFGVGADVVDFLQPGHIHQPGPGADRLVVIGQFTAVGPGSAHAVPVFQVGAECAVPFGQCRNTP
ncbi:hypothetical protein D9M71_583230 [compost metagenome]